MILSIPARHPSRGVLCHLKTASLALAASLLLTGCDTEKASEPQPKEISATAKNDSTGTSAPQRYRIDLSAAGSPIPALDMLAPDGSKKSLTTLKGKPVLLNLWATWCAPCIEELPTLEAVALRVGDAAQVVVLSQDIGSDASVPQAFLRERNLRTLQPWHDPENELSIAVGGALPTTIIYDRNGQEVGRVIGPLDWNGPEASELLRKAGFPA
jgi:thiol-disulfide isomerase/thioredoxin